MVITIPVHKSFFTSIMREMKFSRCCPWTKHGFESTSTMYQTSINDIEEVYLLSFNRVGYIADTGIYLNIVPRVKLTYTAIRPDGKCLLYMLILNIMFLLDTLYNYLGR